MEPQHPAGGDKAAPGAALPFAGDETVAGKTDEEVVATTAHTEIVLTPYGFYGRRKDGCPWVGESTPSKWQARKDAVMHDDDPERAEFHDVRQDQPRP